MQVLIDTHLEKFLTGIKSRETVVACGISGGKDSETLTFEVKRKLKSLNFRGIFVLIHSELGLIEHKESLDQCQKLAVQTDSELIVVRPNLPMIERWERRLVDNSRRFENLERVKLLMPWSSSAMRFCTAEEKVAPITQELKRRYPGKFIINAVGLRRDESRNRAKKPVWKESVELRAVKTQTSGIDWYPILDYSISDVLQVHDRENFPLHPAYARGNERVSCAFCVLASRNDLKAGLTDPYNLAAFRRIVALEFKSTFSFQQDKFLAQIGFDYLTDDEKRTLGACLRKAEQRQFFEKQIPKELLFGLDHFPAFQPDLKQAGALADVRHGIGELLNLEMDYLTAQSVYDRYAQLIEIKEAKEKKKCQKKRKISRELTT